MNRRELANGGASAAVAVAIGPQARSSAAGFDCRATAIKTWAPYTEAIAIDATSGLNHFGGDEPISVIEAAGVRESGLSAVRLTLAPSGRSWFTEPGARRCSICLAMPRMNPGAPLVWG